MAAKDEMLELIKAELEVVEKSIEQTKIEAATEVEVKRLTFLEALEATLQMLEGLPETYADCYVKWALSPAILAFMPKAKHAYRLDAVGYPEMSLSFLVVLDEDRTGKSYISMQLPYRSSSYGSTWRGYYHKEKETLKSLQVLLTYIPRARNNKGGIPKDHPMFDEAEAAILKYVQDQVPALEKSLAQGMEVLDRRIDRLKCSLNAL